MNTYQECKGSGTQSLTRRTLLQTSLAAGLGSAALTASVLPASTAHAARQGGHATILNYAYPELWDPHLAGTLAANAAISPLYNQVVEFNPINPSEVIGDLAQSWEVSAECGVRSAECGVRNAECGVRHAE